MRGCNCGATGEGPASVETGPGHTTASVPALTARGLLRRSVREGFAWLFPSLVIVLMPKCPVCVAGYIALGTGIGLSLSTAATLRRALVLISVAAIGFLTVRLLFRRWQECDIR